MQKNSLKLIGYVTMFLAIGLLPTRSGFAQGHHHGGHHSSWPDSLNVVTLSGTAIVDSSFHHPLYFLDVNGDATADYFLNFGPWWYQPQSGAVRPRNGETIQIVGALIAQMNLPVIIVFEINGRKWRDPVEIGMHGWNGHDFWQIGGDTLTASGTALVDTTYFYPHYFLDTNNDSIPEYQLGFGPPWYQPKSGARRPKHGDHITVFGRVYNTPMGIDVLTVYRLNGLEWRPLNGPAPWAGGWMHRNHSNTTRFYCINDSTQWIDFPSGCMGYGMGWMMWPDSIFVQFWRVYPDSLPGGHTPEHFMGFYFNVHNPQGNSMMGWQMGWGHGMMRFERNSRLVWHYTDEDLQRAGRSENGIQVRYWDANQNQWRIAAGASVNPQTNTVTLTSSENYQYYALYAPQAITKVEEQQDQPADFALYPAYPNPFWSEATSRSAGNPETRIDYQLPQASFVRLAIYNIQGQLVATLVHEKQGAGRYSAVWNGRDAKGRMMASGVYVVRLNADRLQRSQQLTLLK